MTWHDLRCIAVLTAALVGFGAATQADETTTGDPADQTRYDLTYKFSEGQTIRWAVDHRATVRTTIQGTTQTAKTGSKSVKVWNVTEVDSEGRVKFVHQVESVDMVNEISGRSAVRYNSQKDAEAPRGYETVAEAIGVPLTEVWIDRHGKVLSRLQRHGQPGVSDDVPIAIPLPTEPVALGTVWSTPQQVTVSVSDGKTRKIDTRRRFELLAVDEGIARIGIQSQVLTPLNDPKIESQLVQRLYGGEARFDIEKGCIVAQQIDVDRRVLGFSGPTSSMHYLMKLSERLLKKDEMVARRPAQVAGPKPPPGSPLK